MSLSHYQPLPACGVTPYTCLLWLTWCLKTIVHPSLLIYVSPPPPFLSLWHCYRYQAMMLMMIGGLMTITGNVLYLKSKYKTLGDNFIHIVCSLLTQCRCTILGLFPPFKKKSKLTDKMLQISTFLSVSLFLFRTVRV